MKAINCTQCGATLEHISESSMIVECQYCGARIIMSDLPRKPKTNPPVQVTPPNLEIEEPSYPAFVKVGAIAFLALLPIFFIFLAANRREAKPDDRLYSVSSAPANYPTPSSWSVSTKFPDKPMPVVNYQPKLSWDGPYDIVHFEDPDVDISSLSHLTSEEVEKTVFKNRVVKLRVVIDTEGYIDEVETISGHPILVAAATKSAKRSAFKSRSKPTTRILTFTFRVLKD